MEGAGSLRLANYLYRVAPQDGTAIATFGRGIAFDPLLLGQGDAFDAEKLNWIGSANNEVSVCVAMKNSGITKFQDLFTKELTVGGTGASADTDQFPRVLNAVLGTHFKIVARLSRRQRRGAGDGARRGAGPLRLVVVERDIDAQILDRRQAHDRAGAAVADQASRPARRAAGDGLRQDRRAAADPENDVCPQRDGPALSWRRPICRPTALRCCARPSWTPWRTRIFWPKPTRRSSRSIRSPARMSRSW